MAQERLEEAGKAAAAFSQVTHCYERVASPSLDYNLYTMVHETSQENLDRLVEQLRQVIHPKKYLGLPTLRELKKEPMKYFASCSNEHI